MFIGKQNKNKESLTNGELIELLKEYPKDSIILFQDLSFNSSKKQAVLDIVIRQEEYINHKKKQSKAIILLNENLRLGE